MFLHGSEIIFDKKNPELHMTIGDIPIFSKKWFESKKFSDSILDNGVHPETSVSFTVYIKGSFIGCA